MKRLRLRTLVILGLSAGLFCMTACNDDDGSTPPKCRLQTDCPTGFSCDDGRCVTDGSQNECDAENPCDNGSHCDDGRCVTDGSQNECDAENPCDNGSHCDDGRCVTDGSQNECDAENPCDNGSHCDNGTCVTNVDTDACGEDSACDALPLTIGDVGPISDDNPLQQPFACVAQYVTSMDPPVVDNHDGDGFEITDENQNIVGYSRNCGEKMTISYYYRAESDDPGDPLHLYDVENPPQDVKTITVDGDDVPFIVRFERGTINRFIYTITVLSPAPDAQTDLSDGAPNVPETGAWNGDAVFYFGGGTGIGYTQGHKGNATESVSAPGEYHADVSLGLLRDGYAVLQSTGTTMATTYNLKLTGKTAHLIKQEFVKAYGEPRYTFGLGGSGGSVQQFIYAQNYPNLIDGLIAMQPFPDMITQINSVGDCALLNYYFDKVDEQVNGTGSPDNTWTSWKNRQLVVGLHGIDLAPGATPFDGDQDGIRQLTSTAGPGSDVCHNEWFGAFPQFVNPAFGSEGSFSLIDPAILEKTPLSYFDDLVHIFGTYPASDGTFHGTPLARSTIDNVGVQYGLNSLKRGLISIQQFLDINAHVGGWHKRTDLVAPGWPFQGDGPPNHMENVDPWSARNATAEDYTDPTDIAPRSAGDISAMQAAYNAGLVFRGDIDQPIIIEAGYLEPSLNEHASREAFSVRQRLINVKGNADNLVIWMVNSRSDDVKHHFITRALQAETEWLENGAKPASVKDACYDQADLDNPIAEGPGIFEGEVADDGTVQGGMELDYSGPQPGTVGACTQVYPIYSNARLVSGLGVSNDVFKCALKSVDDAIADGTYGNVTFTQAEQDRLHAIFADGVCDYSKPGLGLPVTP